MLAYNECGLKIGDLCRALHSTGKRNPKAIKSGRHTPTHKVTWLEPLLGTEWSVVEIEELPKSAPTVEHRFTLTKEESYALQVAVHQSGNRCFTYGIATNDIPLAKQGEWLWLMGDLICDQRKRELA